MPAIEPEGTNGDLLSTAVIGEHRVASELRKLTVQPEPPPKTSAAEIWDKLKSGNINRVGKLIFLNLFGIESHVQGLGFKVTGGEDLSPESKRAIISELSAIDQRSLSWQEKLKLGAVVAHLGLDLEQARLAEEGDSKFDNKDRLGYLKTLSKPGDVIFVSSAGKFLSVYGQVFQDVTRAVGALEPADERFPFVHVMLNIGHNKLLHLTMRGVKVQSWEDAFLDEKKYKAICLGQIQGEPYSARDVIKEAIEFVRGKRYNYKWLLEALLALPKRREQSHVKDTSVEQSSGVCVDVVTEAIRSLSRRGHKADPEIVRAMVPLDLMKAGSLKITQAITLGKRN